MFRKITSFITMFALVLVSSYASFESSAYAASLTAMSATLSTEKAATLSNYTVRFTTPTGVASGQTIILTFNNSTSLGSVAFGDIDLKVNTVDVTLAASPSGATWGVSVASPVITFTNGTTAVTGGSIIDILIGTHATGGTNQITNGSAGTTLLTISGTFTDTGTIGIPIIADDVVVVNALVQPSISFAVSDNTIYFGNLSTGTACFAQDSDPGAVTCPTQSETEAFNLQAGTNASSGYVITVRGDTLTSGSNTIDPLGSSTASNPGTEQFGIRADVSGAGSGTVTAPFATAAQYAWTATASTAVQLASATTASATNTYSIRQLANISALTEAGTYTSNQTYVATATY